MNNLKFIVPLVTSLLCWPVMAQEHDHKDEDRQQHPDEEHPDSHAEAHEHAHAHPHHAIAILGVYAAGFPKGESVIHHGGGGIAYHTGLIPEKLELEIAVKAVFSGEHHHYPLEIALKIPFPLSERTFLSLGLGPVVALHLHGDEVGFAFGGGVSAELSHWYRPWGGFVIGTAYEILYHEKMIHKMVAVAGPAFGW